MLNLVRICAGFPLTGEPYATVCFVDEDTSKIPDVSIVEASAELLYGLVHQRFILTRAGLQLMVCLHIFCHREPSLSPCCRSTSTKPESSELVLVFTATDAMSCLAVGLTSPV